jgi:hypothetical protein
MSPSGDEAQWRVRVAAGEYGPLDLQTLQAWVRERRVGPYDFVYSAATRIWSPASQVPELRGLFPPAYVAPSPYKGVGGWLLFFCVLLVILAPLGTLSSLSRTTRTADELLGPDHPLKREMLIWTLAGLPAVVLGMVAGLRLWNVKPGAVTLAKIYLWVNVASGLLAFAVGPDYTPLFKAMARQRGVEMDFDFFQVFAFVWSIVWFLIWYSYFRVSKRVKATYGV